MRARDSVALADGGALQADTARWGTLNDESLESRLLGPLLTPKVVIGYLDRPSARRFRPKSLSAASIVFHTVEKLAVV